MRSLAAPTLILLVLSTGCGAPQATAASSQPGATERSDANTRAADAGVDPSLLALVDGGTVAGDAGAAIAPTRSRLTFTNITGRTGDETAMIFQPAAQSIEACGASRGGKLIVKLRTEKGKLVAEPQAGSSLDPSARQCVLDALTEPNVSQSSNLRSGPMVGPTGFTSLLTIEF